MVTEKCKQYLKTPIFRVTSSLRRSPNNSSYPSYRNRQKKTEHK